MSTDTAADDLVTEEMIHVAAEAIDYPSVYACGPREQSKRTAERVLRAVAPLIAERVAEVDAQIANSMDIYGHIAADIRARWEGRP
jgi:hypothetical protein